MADAPPRPAGRMSAEDRREQVLGAARAEFARGGLHGTSTEAIAARAGISQPYLFRLFGTKRDLFLACVERGFAHVTETFRHAAAGAPADERLSAMGRAYEELLGDREELLAQLQAYAACGDPEVRAVVRRRFAELWREAERLSGAAPEAVAAFFATGMLLNVVAAVDLPEVAGEADWAQRFIAKCEAEDARNR